MDIKVNDIVGIKVRMPHYIPRMPNITWHAGTKPYNPFTGKSPEVEERDKILPDVAKIDIKDKDFSIKPIETKTHKLIN